MSYFWTCGSGFIELEFESLEQIAACGPPGDAEDAVRDLAQVPSIALQVRAWDGEKLARTLKEYGAWDAEELADHEMNIIRMLWIASNDVLEQPEVYAQ